MTVQKEIQCLIKTLKIGGGIISLLFVALLTACGGSGGGSDSSSGGVNNTPTFLPDPAVAVADRIASFREAGIFSNSDTPSASDDTHDYTYSETQDIFSLRVGVNNTLIMSVNGVEHALIISQQNFLTWRGRDDSNVVISEFSRANGTSLRDTIVGSDTIQYGTVFRYTADTNDYNSGTIFTLNNAIGYATAGRRTPERDVPQTATARYDGNIEFLITQTRLVRTGSYAFQGYSGDLSMNVDFGAKTVTGTSTVILHNSANMGEINFGSAPIVGNGFAGTFTLDSALRGDAGITDNPTGNYAANFFGPSADDIVGVMRLGGTNANGAVLSVGGFRGDRCRSILANGQCTY